MSVTSKSANWDLHSNGAMIDVVRQTRLPLCITDPHQPDNPIVFVNPAFCDLCGYAEEEVLGRNCRFLQGPETTPESIAQVRKVISNRSVDTVEILNYRKDGSSFVNALQIGPIYDDGGRLLFFFGAQLDITEKLRMEEQARRLAEEEILHRLRNIVNVMSVITRVTAKGHTDVAEFGTALTERLSALSAAHFSAARKARGEIPLADLITSIITAYAPIRDRQFELDGEAVLIPASRISPLSLVLHELATNAAKYGALGCESGVVRLSWQTEMSDGTSALDLNWRERGGPTTKEPTRAGGTGIVRSILMAAGGSLELTWNPEGLDCRIRLPLG